jgi:HK97 family phage prohead protease
MFELRFSPTLEANDSGKLVGYAAVFNSRSHDLGGFVEVIAPDAFNRTLKEFPDVLALIEHDTNRVLARTTNGTLRIAPDAHGLRIEIDPADTSYARDYTTLVKRGDVAGMSFRFRPFAGGDSWDRSGAIPVRTLKSVQLKEVSIVVDPAYPATEVSLRSLPDTTQQALRSLRLRLAAL